MSFKEWFARKRYISRGGSQSSWDDGDESDLLKLILKNKVEVDVKGMNIQQMSLKVRRLIDENITVTVPVGTFFVSSNAGVQNMITTEEDEFTLYDDDWKEVTISVACTNRTYDIPTDENAFTVRYASHQAELAQLIPELKNESFGTLQAWNAGMYILAYESFSKKKVLL